MSCTYEDVAKAADAIYASKRRIPTASEVCAWLEQHGWLRVTESDVAGFLAQWESLKFPKQAPERGSPPRPSF